MATISGTINKIKTNIQNAYSEVESLGGTLPTTQNAANLATSIASIGGTYLPLAGGTMTGNILPNTTNCNLGSKSNHWGEVHANNICVAGHDVSNPICGIKGSDGITYVYCGASTKIVDYSSNDTLKDLYAANYHATTAFYQDSDARLKNVHGEIDLNKAYDLIDKCSTILYDFKSDEAHKEQIGMIAQEVKEFFPEIVSENEEGFLSLDYAKLTVVILRVMKDLIKRIEKLEK